jgi:endoglucanase
LRQSDIRPRSANSWWLAASVVVVALQFLAWTAAPALSAEAAAIRYNRLLGRGINLVPKSEPWGVTLRSEYFREIKKAGFKSVRIPVSWSANASEVPPYTIDPEFLKRVDWGVHQVLSRGLVAVVDVHNYVELEKRPDENMSRLTALWAQLGRHYRNYPDRLYFELLNEPSGALTDDKWQGVMLTLLRTVRESNPARMVIIGPGNWNSIDHLANLRLPSDDRHIIVTIHYYTPLQFTHQGASWVPGSDKWMGTKWTDTPEEQGVLDRDFGKAASWARRNNRPVYLGEFGAFEAADMDSRARWTRAVVKAAERRKFSWAYWEFCSGFGAYDPVALKWRTPLLDALNGHV